MKITCDTLEQLVTVYKHFSIPINVAGMTVSFPYVLELKQIVGLPVEDEREYSFEEFEEKYLNQKSNAI